MNTYTTFFSTPLGTCTLEANNDGLSSCKFTKDFIRDNKNDHVYLNNHLLKSKNQILDYFKGILTSFNLKLNPIGTEFQKKVWKELSLIPYGNTIDYQTLAIKSFNNKNYSRAVALANSKNPLLLIVPCHRVINKDGSLGGYSAGIEMKKEMLLFESFNLNN